MHIFNPSPTPVLRQGKGSCAHVKISGVFSAETLISFPVCCALGKHAQPYCSLFCSALTSSGERVERRAVRYGTERALSGDGYSGGSSRSGCDGTVQVHANDSPPRPLAHCSCSAHRQSSVPLFRAPVSSIHLRPHHTQLASSEPHTRPASSSPRLARETLEPYHMARG